MKRKKKKGKHSPIVKVKKKGKSVVVRPLGIHNVCPPIPKNWRGPKPSSTSDQQLKAFAKGEEIRLEAWTLSNGVPSECEGAIDFRIVVPAKAGSNGIKFYPPDPNPFDDTIIVGSGTLFAPNAEATLEALHRGKLGILLLLKNGSLKKLPPHSTR